MPRSSDGSAHHDDGPLIATPDDPEARNGLSRRGRLLAGLRIGVLAVIAAPLGITASSRALAVPAPSLTPAEPGPTASTLRRAIGDEDHRERLATRGYDRFLTVYSADAVIPRAERIWLDAAETASGEAVGAGSTVRKGTP